jgi:1,4-dihydroxy-6-naphthoate synthase
MLFTLAYPNVMGKVFMPFHEIEDAVLQGRVDAGVIIHENRFTYADRGLIRLCDLGEVWEHNTGQPIPLGGIVMKRTLSAETMEKTDRVIRRSLEHAWSRYPELPDMVRLHAQTMEEDVMRKHIELYVNEFSRSLGKEGRAAVWKLLETAEALHPAPVAGSFEVFR